MAGKLARSGYSTTNFSESVVVGGTSYQMLEVLPFGNKKYFHNNRYPTIPSVVYITTILPIVRGVSRGGTFTRFLKPHWGFLYEPSGSTVGQEGSQ